MAPLSDSLKDFAETPTGRIVVVAVPAAILALIIAFVALTMLRDDGASEIADTGAGSNKAAPSVAKNSDSTSTSPAVDGATGNAGGGLSESSETTSYINENFEVYETRDPFKAAEASVTVSAAPAADPASGGTPSGSTNAGLATQVLTLRGIQEGQDGVSYADVTYGAAPYTVKEGERIGSSSYKVVSVGSDSATFLYGDDQVVLRIGESADK